MKLFKVIIYLIYVPSIVLVLMISINLYEALDLFKDWGWFKYFSDLPVLGRKLLYALCGLMTLELIIENIYVIKVSKQLRTAKEEIKKLEEGFYEKAQEEVSKEGFSELRLVDLSNCRSNG